MNFGSSIQVAVISTFYYTVLIGFLCFTMAKGLSLSGVSSNLGVAVWVSCQEFKTLYYFGSLSLSPYLALSAYVQVDVI